jgi:membrane-bound ClpP family serine protease
MGTVQILGLIVLLGVEFILPGFGIPGIAGIIFTAAGIFLTGRNASERIMVGAIAVVIIAVMLVVSILAFSSKKIKSPIKLDTDLPGKNLFIDEQDMEYLIGKKGVAVTDLKPSGKGEFDGVKFDILSGNYYIKRGAALVITEVKNNRIIVEEEK